MTPRSTSRLVTSLIKALGLKPAKSRRAPRRIRSQPAQSSSSRLAQAGRTLRFLTDEQRELWRAYASTQTAVDPKTNTLRTRQYDKVFVGLTCRFLHCTPQGMPPLTPPPFPFAGDPITVTAEGVPGGVRWTASGPTSPHVRVELLLQDIVTPSRSPQPGRYRTQTFASFTDAPVITLCWGGWMVPAYRFVDARTGQDTPLTVLPKVLMLPQTP